MNTIYNREYNNNSINPNGYVVSICGSMSSMISLMVVHPFDNIRVR